MISLGVPIMLFSILLGQNVNLADTEPGALHRALVIAFSLFVAVNLMAAIVSWMRPPTLQGNH